MSAPDLILGGRTPHDYCDTAEHKVNITIASDLVLETKPDERRPFTMLATVLTLRWTWHNNQWQLNWAFYGRRWRKTTHDWSPHVQGYLTDWDIDLPEWVQPLIEANAPTTAPTVGGEA